MIYFFEKKMEIIEIKVGKQNEKNIKWDVSLRGNFIKGLGEEIEHRYFITSDGTKIYDMYKKRFITFSFDGNYYFVNFYKDGKK